jgi:hypothetical protein
MRSFIEFNDTFLYDNNSVRVFEKSGPDVRTRTSAYNARSFWEVSDTPKPNSTPDKNLIISLPKSVGVVDMQIIAEITESFDIIGLFIIFCSPYNFVYIFTKTSE